MTNLLTQPETTTRKLLQPMYDAAVLFDDPTCPVAQTEIYYDHILSEKYHASIWLASELHQPIGAYKIRGAWNFVHHLTAAERARGIVTASAGNHAQGIALSAREHGIRAIIFMPEATPMQKIQKTKELGGSLIDIVLEGSTYDACEGRAREYQTKSGAVFAHPFDDERVIAGQGTLGLEIAQVLPHLDMAICPVGGGGLIAGVSTALKTLNPHIKIIGAEPAGAASLQFALQAGKAETMPQDIDTFVDGASVKKIGPLAFETIKRLVDSVVCVKNDDTRRTVTELWERPQPIRVELAGALSVCALQHLVDSVQGKTVVCVLSGGNLSPDRYQQHVKLEELNHF